MTASDDLQLNAPPTDSISSLSFSPTVPHLLVAGSWDKSVSVYDTALNQLKIRYSHNSPVLSALLSDDSKCYSAGLDGQVWQCDLSTETATPFHSSSSSSFDNLDISETKDIDKAVKSLCYLESKSLLICGGWDKRLCMVDTRAHSKSSSSSSASYLDLPGKCYSMSLGQANLLIVGMSERLVNVYDLRNMKEPYQRRESSLKFQTRCVAAFPSANSFDSSTSSPGYIISSIEGRVGVEYIDPAPEQQSKKYAFKCHRQTIDGVDTVYPVHALAFHPLGTFASGGGDGVVNVWDGAAKKRLRQYPKYPTSIAALSFNVDGSQLAIASSYCYEQGERSNMPPTSIFIKPIVDAEVRPKSATL